MIGKVAPAGKKTTGLLRYLYRLSSHHSDPHVIGGFQPAAVLEPPLKASGRPDLEALAATLEAPLALLDPGRDRSAIVWHASFRAHKADRILTDAEWREIAEEAMHRTGLYPRGREDTEGVPWAVIRHAPDHVHIVAVRVRPRGRHARLWHDRDTLVDVAAWAEKTYGLTRVPRPGRNHGGRKAGRPETEKAARHKRPEPPRDTLRRHTEAAAAAAADEAAFWAGLQARGLKVRFRRSPDRRRHITGYAVGLDGDLNRDGGQVWYGGSKLAAGLSLPRLRRRWDGGPLAGHRMTGPTARTVLTREVTAAASAAATESAFFAALKARGIDVTFRTAPGRPGSRTGYSVALPGLTARDGQPLRFAGGTLSPALTLGNLRARWRAGLPGTAPPGLYDGADAARIWNHATTVAREAAAELQAGRAGPGTALAAADILTVAADVTGSTQLRKAAAGFSLAAQLPARERLPPPDPLTRALRTSARLIASSRPPAPYRSTAPAGTPVLLLLVALVVIAMVLALLRMLERREYQARHAMNAGLRLVTAADDWTPTSPDRISFPGRPRLAGKQNAARQPARRRGPARSTRPSPRVP